MASREVGVSDSDLVAGIERIDRVSQAIVCPVTEKAGRADRQEVIPLTASMTKSPLRALVRSEGVRHGDGQRLHEAVGLQGRGPARRISSTCWLL